MTDAIRILYVDDEPILLKTGKFYLERKGEFAVDTLISAKEAFTRMETERYDAIISDYQMPGMDGIEFLKTIRASGNTIPFILYTGKGREEVVITALNEGADFYIQKGGEPEPLFAELGHKIRSAVERHTIDKALQKSEEKYRRIVETSHEGIWAMDGQFVTTYVNERMAEMLGYTINEILGKTIQSFMSGEDLADQQKKIEERMQGQPGSYERRFRAKDGTILTFAVSATPVMGDECSFKGSFAMLTDITARKRAEEELIKNAEELHASYEEITATEEELRANLDQMTRQEQELQESQEKYRSLFTDSRDGIVMVDEQGRFLDANEVYCAMLGYSVEELRTISFPGITPEKWQAWEGEEIWNRRLIKDGYTGIYEKEYVRKDGIIFPVELQAFTVFDTNRNIKYVWGTVRDITERKQQELELLKNTEELHASYEEITATEEELRANLDQLTRQEQELRESKRELSDIIEFLPDATFVLDRKGIVIAWNHAIEKMTGISKEEMIGKGDHAYTIPFYGDRRKHLLDLIDLENKELQAKYRHVTRKGNTLYAETFAPALFGGKGAYVWVTGSPLFDLQKNRIGAIESIRDITERKQVEAALRESKRQLDAMATNIPGVVFRYYVNPDGTTGFDYISGRSREILGLENDKATFDNQFTEGIVPENRERFLSSIQHAVTTKTLWEFDSPYVKPSGEKIWVSAVSSPVMENDRLIFDGAFFDITHRKKAEEEIVKKNEELHASNEQLAAAEEELRGNIDELTRQERALITAERETRESRDLMRAYLDHSYDAVFIHDNGGKVLDVNATALRLYRVTRKEALGYTIADFTGPACALDKAQEHWERVLAGEDRFFPWQARRPNDGSLFDVEVYLTQITLDGRQIILANIRDITERKRAEEEIVKKNEELHAANEQLAAAEEELKGQFDALAESEERVRNKLESLLSPEGDISNLHLADIIDVQEIKSMMDDFHALTHIGIAILDINGKILVATGWQDICTKFHRVNPETCANCLQSDTFLASGVEPGTVKHYRCKNNMWDLVTPIVIGGSHVGNLFLGQFLFEDETVDYDLFRSQAARYGFDESSYLAALERVPRWNRETVDTVMAFYAKFARMVSTLSHSNITLARTVTERDTTLNSLLKVNQKLNVLSQLTRQDLTTQIFIVNSFLEMAKKQAKGQDGIIKNIESGERAVRSIKEITEFTKDYQNMGEKPPKWQNVKLSFLFGLSHISIGEIRHSLETENLEIFADPLLEKAFQGLLENSVKHGGHVSEIRVSHTVTPDWVTVVFEDNGVGISAEKKERIFLRGEGPRASVRGLFFVQEILSITGIIIRENGEPGKGTRFEMTVPKGAYRLTDVQKE